jgi:hypothetical protein
MATSIPVMRAPLGNSHFPFRIRRIARSATIAAREADARAIEVAYSSIVILLHFSQLFIFNFVQNT